MNFQVTKSNVIFNGKVFDIQVDSITYPTGNDGVREVVVHPGGAVVAALTDEDEIILVSQFRYPLKKRVLELPAGKLEKGEDPEGCALRELKEETGFSAERIDKLGAIATTPGFCSEILHIYLARGLKKGNHNREEGERDMKTHFHSLRELDDLIATGEIFDSKTICGIAMTKLFLERNASG